MDRPTNILDVPLDVWHWYGDEAFSRKLRMCHPALAVPAQSRTSWSALGMYSFTLGRYCESHLGGHFIIWQRGAELCEGVVGYGDHPGAKCVTSRGGRSSTVWTVPAAELSYYFAALRIDEDHGRPLDITYDTCHDDIVGASSNPTKDIVGASSNPTKDIVGASSNPTKDVVTTIGGMPAVSGMTHPHTHLIGGTVYSAQSPPERGIMFFVACLCYNKNGGVKIIIAEGVIIAATR